MGKFKPPTKETGEKYNQIINQGQDSGLDSLFPIHSIKSQYSMFGFIFMELANLRMEVSRLGYAVRINTPDSPSYLIAYHSHIYSLLIPMSPIIEKEKWKKIEKMWLDCKANINTYLTQRKNIPNKSIPFELIFKLDRLYRIALLVAQKAGLGISIESDVDVERAIESAIIGG